MTPIVASPTSLPKTPIPQEFPQKMQAQFLSDTRVLHHQVFAKPAVLAARLSDIHVCTVRMVATAPMDRLNLKLQSNLLVGQYVQIHFASICFELRLAHHL